jgi:hypothetical protein
LVRVKGESPRESKRRKVRAIARKARARKVKGESPKAGEGERPKGQE